jgi:hypothetical protein
MKEVNCLHIFQLGNAKSSCWYGGTSTSKARRNYEPRRKWQRSFEAIISIDNLNGLAKNCSSLCCTLLLSLLQFFYFIIFAGNIDLLVLDLKFMNVLTLIHIL